MSRACKSDGGLVENIEDAAKARANLRGQTDALGFAAGKRGRGAIQAEVVQADGEEKVETLGDFFQRSPGDIALALRKLREDFVDGRARGAQRQRREVRDGVAGVLDRERFGPQPLAVADAAQRRGHVLRHPLAIGIGIGLLEIALEEFQNPRESETLFRLEPFSRRDRIAGPVGDRSFDGG